MKRDRWSFDCVEPNVYHKDSLPVPYIARRKRYSEEVFECCDCESKCDPEECICLKRGPNFQCQDDCSCFWNCGRSKDIVHGPCIPLLIFDTQTCKGLGVKALECIKEGTFVCEYVGDVAAEKAADNSYVLNVVEHFSCSRSSRLVQVDALENGNVGRYINHSCDPNLRVDMIFVESDVPHVCFFSTQQIEAGEEITFDYDGSSNDGADLSETVCGCHAKNCRGFLPRHGNVINKMKGK